VHILEGMWKEIFLTVFIAVTFNLLGFLNLTGAFAFFEIVRFFS
jgi:hypothetical protein